MQPDQAARRTSLVPRKRKSRSPGRKLPGNMRISFRRSPTPIKELVTYRPENPVTEVQALKNQLKSEPSFPPVPPGPRQVTAAPPSPQSSRSVIAAPPSPQPTPAGPRVLTAQEKESRDRLFQRLKGFPSKGRGKKGKGQKGKGYGKKKKWK